MCVPPPPPSFPLKPAVGYSAGRVAGFGSPSPHRWPACPERVRVCTDNFLEQGSIDLYKPGTIEVKGEGDKKKAIIERASTVVSLITLPTFPAVIPEPSLARSLTILRTARRGPAIYWYRELGQGCGLRVDIR